MTEERRMNTENKPAPTCPYCGDEIEMKLSRDWVFAFYKCFVCGSTSPAKRTEKEAYEAAMQREKPSERLSLRTRAIITAYTDYSMLRGEELNELYKYLEELFGRPVYTHEIPKLADEIRKRSKKDFIALCAASAEHQEGGNR